jgi:hypothetical protein
MEEVKASEIKVEEKGERAESERKRKHDPEKVVFNE